MDQPLTSVHTALQNASMASKPLPGKPLSFRLDDDVRGEVSEICERHGTTISEFLRQCCIGLARDYNPTRG